MQMGDLGSMDMATDQPVDPAASRLIGDCRLEVTDIKHGALDLMFHETGCVPLIQDRGDPSGLISLKDRGFLQGCIHRVRSRVHVCTDNRSDHHRGH